MTRQEMIAKYAEKTYCPSEETLDARKIKAAQHVDALEAIGAVRFSHRDIDMRPTFCQVVASWREAGESLESLLASMSRAGIRIVEK